MAGPPPGTDRTRLLLWALGGAQLAAYFGVAALSTQFEYGREERPVLAVVGLFVAATACYFAALAGVLRTRSDDRGVLRIVLLFAVVDRLVLLPSQPILEVDFYRYLWDGRVMLNGFNPYRFSPWQVRDPDVYDDPPADLLALGEVGQQSAAVQTVLQRVHYPEAPTVYPPAAQLVFTAAAALTPVAAPLDVHIWTLKALLLVFDLGTVAVLAALLRRLALPAAWCLAYAWCPLVLKEVANSGHLDSIAVFCTTAALYLLVRGSVATAGLGTACLGVGVLAKSYPVILVPVVGAYLLSRRAAAVLLVLPAVVLAGYLPFLASAPEGSAAAAHHPGSGLKRFLTEWETNDFLFMLVYHNLSAPQEVPAPWYVVVLAG